VIERVVELVGGFLALYVAAGAAVAVALHVRGLRRIDPAVRGAGVLFRILITPGLTALWPLMLARWWRAIAGNDTAAEVHRPLPARALRATHRRLAQALTIVIPIAAGAGLVLRPTAPRTASTPAPPFAEPLPRVIRTVDAPFGHAGTTLRLRGNDQGRRQVEIVLGGDLEQPSVVVLWSPGRHDRDLRSAALLGAVWGPGVRRYDLPPGAEVRGGTLVLYSLARNERVGSYVLEE
jgi:hypothetical protein